MYRTDCLLTGESCAITTFLGLRCRDHADPVEVQAIDGRAGWYAAGPGCSAYMHKALREVVGPRASGTVGRVRQDAEDNWRGLRFDACALAAARGQDERSRTCNDCDPRHARSHDGHSSRGEQRRSRRRRRQKTPGFPGSRTAPAATIDRTVSSEAAMRDDVSTRPLIDGSGNAGVVLSAYVKAGRALRPAQSPGGKPEIHHAHGMTIHTAAITPSATGNHGRALNRRTRTKTATPHAPPSIRSVTHMLILDATWRAPTNKRTGISGTVHGTNMTGEPRMAAQIAASRIGCPPRRRRSNPTTRWSVLRVPGTNPLVAMIAEVPAGSTAFDGRMAADCDWSQAP